MKFTICAFWLLFGTWLGIVPAGWSQEGFFEKAPLFRRYDLTFKGRLRDLTLEDVLGGKGKEVVVLERQGSYPAWTHRLLIWSLEGKRSAPGTPLEIELPKDTIFYRFISLSGEDGRGLLLHRAGQLEFWGSGPDRWVRKTGTQITSPFSKPGEGSPRPFLPYADPPTGRVSNRLWIPLDAGLGLYEIGAGRIRHVRTLIVQPRVYYRTSIGRLPFDLPFWLKSSIWFPTMVEGAWKETGSKYLFLPWMDEVELVPLGSRSPAQRIYLDQLSEAERDDALSYVVTEPDDLDGDGLTDLLVNKFKGAATSLQAETRIFLGTENGFSKKGLPLKPEGNRAAGALAVDLNLDGKKDLAVASAQFNAWAIVRALVRKQVQVNFEFYYFHDNGYRLTQSDFNREISFRFDLRHAEIDGILPTLDGDFNGDGYPDALYARDRKGLTILIQKPKAKLPFDPVPSGVYEITVPRLLKVADLNGDRKSDIALYTRRSSGNRKVSILVNTGRL